MPVGDRMDRQIVTYVAPAVKNALIDLAQADARALSNYVALVLSEHIKSAR